MKLVKTVLEEALTLAVSKGPTCVWWGGGQRPRLQSQHVRLGWTLSQVTVFEEADSKPTATSVARRRPPLSGRLQDTRTAKKCGCFYLRHFKIVWCILCHHGDWIIYPPTDERVVYALWHGRIDPKTLRFISRNLIFTILRAQKQNHLPSASTRYVFYLDVALIFYQFQRGTWEKNKLSAKRGSFIFEINSV